MSSNNDRSMQLDEGVDEARDVGPGPSPATVFEEHAPDGSVPWNGNTAEDGASAPAAAAELVLNRDADDGADADAWVVLDLDDGEGGPDPLASHAEACLDPPLAEPTGGESWWSFAWSAAAGQANGDSFAGASADAGPPGVEPEAAEGGDVCGEGLTDDCAAAAGGVVVLAECMPAAPEPMMRECVEANRASVTDEVVRANEDEGEPTARSAVVVVASTTDLNIRRPAVVVVPGMLPPPALTTLPGAPTEIDKFILRIWQSLRWVWDAILGVLFGYSAGGE